MNVVLVPGFWLGSWAWDAVTPVLAAAGHSVTALTLPGLGPDDTDPAAVTLADQIDAVVRTVDSLPGPVVLVGHSGGGPICHATAAARPDRIARVIHVDTWPAPEGRCINDGLPVADGLIPFPDWAVFDEPDLVDMDGQTRDMLLARAVAQPARVASDRFVLSGDDRHRIPTTVIACEFSSAQLKEWMAAGAPELAELALMRDVTWIDLPTGHWPMFTRAGDLGAVLSESIGA